MQWLSKKQDYTSLLKDISNIELANENIDSKTTSEKILLLRTLKNKIESSEILKNNNNEPAQTLIRAIYDLLYTKQSDFPESYYTTLSNTISNAHSYIELVRPYEMFLAEKISSLTNLANAASQTDEQKRMSSILNSKIGVLKRTMIAIIIALTTLSCTISVERNLNFIYETKDHTRIEYKMNMESLESYRVPNGKKIKDSELGKMLAQRPAMMIFSSTGQQEEGMTTLYSYANDNIPDMIVIRKTNKTIMGIMLNKYSKSYNLIKKKLGNRIILQQNQ